MEEIENLNEQTQSAQAQRNGNNSTAGSASQSSSASDPNSRWSRLSSKWQHYKRVVKVTKKPSKDEFWTTFKVTGLGILLIGLIGFLILTLKIIGKNLFGV